jgi:hypothetical protein
MSISQQLQLPIFAQQVAETTPESHPAELYAEKELGTFKDSLRAPIYRWFKYPAGYSYKFVQASFELFNVGPGDWVYDPFSGSGTTLLCAKQAGINGYGVEAHSFVHWVAQVKLYWEYDLAHLNHTLDTFLTKSRAIIREQLHSVDLTDVFPELIYKCYHPLDLKTLFLLREFILTEIDDPAIQNFLKLALTDSLRGASSAGTGWPYIAPRKNKPDVPLKDAFSVFQKTVRLMYEDICTVRATTGETSACHIRNILGDSRERQDVAEGQIKLALTSPPYLNNYDYADRTRLETYFWGIANSWNEITRNFRDKLMVAATTQITRGQYEVETVLTQEIAQVDPQIYQFLQKAHCIVDCAQGMTRGRRD